MARRSSVFPTREPAVCVRVLGRKLVEQLYLLSQTLERTCPNRQTHTLHIQLCTHTQVPDITGSDKAAVSFQLLRRDKTIREQTRRAQRQTRCRQVNRYTGVSVIRVIMSISVSLRKITNLPGRSDRKVELTFRGQ